jgi:GT2 family glycosyltransferase
VSISVLIATRDRPEHLRRCLQSLAAVQPGGFEIIVADQSSDDASKRVVAEFPGLNVRHLPLSSTGKGRGLNAALTAATGDIVALTDDDCEAPSGWLQRGEQVLRDHPEAGVVYGALRAVDHDPTRTYVPEFLPPKFRIRRGRFISRPHRIGVDANAFIRRAVFERTGGFDEYQGPGGLFRSGEDWEFAYRAAKAGYALVQDPENVVIHHGARDYESGAPRRMLSSNYHGIGAGYARHLRARDLWAGYLLLQEAAIVSADVTWNIVRLRRPFGFRRLSSMLLGAGRGLRSPHRPGEARIAPLPAPAAEPQSEAVSRQ